jgi:hypothetical protein
MFYAGHYSIIGFLAHDVFKQQYHHTLESGAYFDERKPAVCMTFDHKIDLLSTRDASSKQSLLFPSLVFLIISFCNNVPFVEQLSNSC